MLVAGTRILFVGKGSDKALSAEEMAKVASNPASSEDREIWSEKPPVPVPWMGVPVVNIDAHSKTLLPGLWDMHAHVGDNDGLLNLAAGVTTVRDLANDTDTLLARRQRIADGKKSAPASSSPESSMAAAPIKVPPKFCLHRSRSPRRRRRL